MKQPHPLHHELLGMIDTSPVGHDGDAVCLLADRLNATIDEYAFVHHRGLYTRPQEQDAIALPNRDFDAVLRYATAHGVPETSLRSPRFDGTWCVWTHRENHPEQRFMTTGSAIDTNAALRLRLEQVFGMEAQFWLNFQVAWDLYRARHSPQARKIARIPRHPKLAVAS